MSKPAKKMPDNVSVLTIRCPVTLDYVRIGATGVWSDAAEEDQLDYPLGWARTIHRRVIANPDHAAWVKLREDHAVAAMAHMRAVAAEAGQEMDEVEGRAEVDRAFARIGAEEPDETMTVEIAWDMCAEGEKAYLEALAGLKFPIGDLPA